MLRDAAGRAQVATPSAAADIATKGYADGALSALGNGYVKLPNGFIMQWGTVYVSGNTDTAVTLPIAFPNGALNGLASYNGNTETTYVASVVALSNTQITVRSAGNNGKTINWLAFGA